MPRFTRLPIYLVLLAVLGSLNHLASSQLSAQQPVAGGNYATNPYAPGSPAATTAPQSASRPQGQVPLGTGVPNTNGAIATQGFPTNTQIGPSAQNIPGAQNVPGAQNIPGAQNTPNPQPVPASQTAGGSAPAGSATEPAGVVNPVAPFPALDAQWQAYLDKVLEVWEQKTSDVTRYACTFRRYQYDPTLAAQDAYTIAAGTLKYSKPDKGLFKVDQLVYHRGSDKDGKPQYQENPQRKYGEYWICDGKYVHILDENEKKCTKYELPPSVRGNSIYLSPLPFLFGVKAAEIKSRYWIKPLPLPQGRTNEVWLEAFPRRADDAANYQRVQVVLDLKDWMPKGLIVFLPNYRPEAPHRELYEFDNRQVNESLLDRLNFFDKEFIPAEPPKDWKVIVEPYQAPPAEGAQAAPRVATPPVAPAPVR